jgi:NAD(P)H-dependent flavin oxidoreductase YrpB (nitropropane dioxygenase family)
VLRTRFTDLVGCALPVQSAGMATSSPALAGAVARAGALGTASGTLLSPAGLERTLDDVGEPGPGAVGVNFIVPFLEDPSVVDVAARRARVVEFFYADPDPALVDRVHAGGALAAWQVGSTAEAVAAAHAGCDLVIVQGVEAGGHVRGRLGLLPLLAEVLDAVECPVVAAGGISSPRAMAAALAAGAAAVRIGTSVVVAAESGFHPRYKQALVEAAGEDAVYTDCFSVMWPDAPHRVLRSSLQAAEAFDGEVVGEILLGDERQPVPRFSVPSPTESATGAIEAMPHYAGQGAGSVRAVRPAAVIVRELVAGAESLLRSQHWTLEGPEDTGDASDHGSDM